MDNLVEFYSGSYKQRWLPFLRPEGADTLQTFFNDPNNPYFVLFRDNGSFQEEVKAWTNQRVGIALQQPEFGLFKLCRNKRLSFSIDVFTSDAKSDAPNCRMTIKFQIIFNPEDFCVAQRDALATQQFIETSAIAFKIKREVEGVVAREIERYAFRELASPSSLRRFIESRVKDASERLFGATIEQLSVDVARSPSYARKIQEYEDRIADCVAKLEGVEARRGEGVKGREAQLLAYKKSLEGYELAKDAYDKLTSEAQRKAEMNQQLYESQLEVETLGFKKERAELEAKIAKLENELERERESSEYAEQLEKIQKRYEERVESQSRLLQELSQKSDDILAQTTLQGQKTRDEVVKGFEQFSEKLDGSTNFLLDSIGKLFEKYAVKLSASGIKPTVSQVMEAYEQENPTDSTRPASDPISAYKETFGRTTFAIRNKLKELGQTFDMVIPSLRPTLVTTRAPRANRHKNQGRPPVRPQGPNDFSANVVRINSDMAFEITAPISGYLTFINLGTSGAYWLVLPNSENYPGKTYVREGETLKLPDDITHESMYEDGPVGWEEQIAIITPNPLFNVEELVSEEGYEPYVKVSIDRMLRLCADIERLNKRDVAVATVGFNVVLEHFQFQ